MKSDAIHCISQTIPLPLINYDIKTIKIIPKIEIEIIVYFIFLLVYANSIGNFDGEKICFDRCYLSKKKEKKKKISLSMLR